MPKHQSTAARRARATQKATGVKYTQLLRAQSAGPIARRTVRPEESERYAECLAALRRSDLPELARACLYELLVTSQCRHEDLYVEVDDWAIADAAGMDVYAVDVALMLLEELGWIRKVEGELHRLALPQEHLDFWDGELATFQPAVADPQKYAQKLFQLKNDPAG
ncbi:hypothetical protein [Streptomyces sp. A1136]|uniref:hypothetical protein n=1 Tax=Streptomyces sp. A1136 TaxID=2563102 RepID=UPI00109E6E39|nr:hypothetical protein [Streptomyces sp. A1136]THA53196.1 hypothetical protein E6R62_19060 [Streptomyces sp. A1136]